MLIFEVIMLRKHDGIRQIIEIFLLIVNMSSSPNGLRGHEWLSILF